MEALFVLVLITSIVFNVFKFFAKKKNKKNRSVQAAKNIRQQQALLQEVAKSLGYDMPLVDVAKENELRLASSIAENRRQESRFSIGWLVFFVTLAVLVFWIFQPWIETFFVLGPKTFIQLY